MAMAILQHRRHCLRRFMQAAVLCVETKFYSPVFTNGRVVPGIGPCAHRRPLLLVKGRREELGDERGHRGCVVLLLLLLR